MADLSFYDVLGVGADASSSVIRSAYVRLSRSLLPRRGSVTPAFKRLNAAYAVLRNPRARSAYDRALFYIRHDDPQEGMRYEDNGAVMLAAHADLIVRGLRRSGLRRLGLGLVVLAFGVAVSGFSHTLAPEAGRFLLIWGALLLGSVLSITGIYGFLTPRIATRRILARAGADVTKEPRTFSERLRAIFVIILLATLLAIGWMGIGNASDGMASLSASPSPATSSTSLGAPGLLEEYDSCISDYSALLLRLDFIDGQIDGLTAAGNTARAEGLATDQRSIISEAQVKYDDCSAIRVQYDADGH